MDRGQATYPMSRSCLGIQKVTCIKTILLLWLPTGLPGENLKSPALQPNDDGDDETIHNVQGAIPDKNRPPPIEGVSFFFFSVTEKYLEFPSKTGKLNGIPNQIRVK